MPISHEAVEKDQYDKLNALSVKVEGLVGVVNTSNDILVKQMMQNAEEHKAAMDKMQKMHDSYVTMTKYIIGLLFLVIFSLVGEFIYGAIGKAGLYAVRDSMPKVACVPWHNDLDRYTRRISVG